MRRIIILTVLMVAMCFWHIDVIHGLPAGAVARLGKGFVNEVAFSPDGRYLAVASSSVVYLYDPHTLQEAYLFEKGAWTYPVSFSPDGRLVASGSLGGTVMLWRMPPGAK